MKTSYLRKLCVSALALSAGYALSADAAVLMHEDWSNIAENGTAVSGGNWTMSNGLASQIVLAIDPGSFDGRFVTPVLYGETDGLQLLPTLQSANSYTYGPEGLSISAQVALGSGNDKSNYFRIGIRSATNSTHNYWFDLYGTYARFQKQIGSPFAAGDNYNYTGLTTPINNLRDITFNVVPIEEGNRLTLLIDGIEVLTYDDITGSIPSFTSGVYVTIAMRSPRTGYVGEVTLQSIPEPGGITLALGGAAALLFAHRTHRRRSEKAA